MYVTFVAGGIASGKSTVSRRLGRLGAALVDLDALSREVCAPGSPVLARLAEEFGDDVLDPATGELRRAELARRAFASPAATRALERIEHPAIKEALAARLGMLAGLGHPPRLCVVEVPLLDKALDLVPLADEVVAVTCPAALRRERAVERGMEPADVDRRMAAQPAEAFLVEHADTVIENVGTYEELIGEVDRWYGRRARRGFSWPPEGSEDEQDA